MPKRRKTEKPQGLTGRLALPVAALAIAITTGVIALIGGAKADGTPALVVIPVNGLVLVTTPVLAGMMLLRAAGRQVAWRTAGVGAALLAASCLLAVGSVHWFDTGFRSYVGARATEQELKAAAAELLGRQQGIARTTLSFGELPAGTAALEPVRRLHPKYVTVEPGGRKQDAEVYLGWGSETYGWGIGVTPKKVEYRHGE